ncbi:substrate-binding periplasmic protein [Pseudoalteromonas tunicata]|uniref:substrate-binding periplasmic protein n=1 Tax=Pseudoalteromonas tunicata TaxID=314281 RepID=UPI00273E389A|nr:transporter substrate-binding domain-containing protein [Pseudoalteromonas tunicata]MDP4985759.1 transporter substrate-binding domain-containing protein [Pseudoalteromonas tunicata]
MFYHHILLVALFLSVTAWPVNSQTIRITADHWQHFTETGGRGIYFELLKKIYSEDILTFNADDFSRSLNLFNTQKADIMVGVYQSDLPNAHFPTWPIDTDSPIFSFVLKDSQFNSIESLNNKTIAWKKGYGFAQFFPNVHKPYLVEDIDTGFKLLQAKRIDAFFDYEANFKQANYQNVTLFKIHDTETLYVAFQNTENGRKLAAIYDKKMALFRENGTLMRIFGQSYERSLLSEFKEAN